MVPLSGQDPPNAVKGEGSTIGLGLIKLLMSQEGVSDSVLCITTLSTMINLFHGNQSVLFSDMKGDLSKTRVTEMPPTATRSKLEKRKPISLFLFVLSLYYHNFQCIKHKNFMLLITALDLPCEIIQAYLLGVTLVFTKLYLSVLSLSMHQS